MNLHARLGPAQGGGTSGGSGRPHGALTAPQAACSASSAPREPAHGAAPPPVQPLGSRRLSHFLAPSHSQEHRARRPRSEAGVLGSRGSPSGQAVRGLWGQVVSRPRASGEETAHSSDRTGTLCAQRLATGSSTPGSATGALPAPTAAGESALSPELLTQATLLLQEDTRHFQKPQGHLPMRLQGRKVPGVRPGRERAQIRPGKRVTEVGSRSPGSGLGDPKAERRVREPAGQSFNTRLKALVRDRTGQGPCSVRSP